MPNAIPKSAEFAAIAVGIWNPKTAIMSAIMRDPSAHQCVFILNTPSMMKNAISGKIPTSADRTVEPPMDSVDGTKVTACITVEYKCSPRTKVME